MNSANFSILKHRNVAFRHPLDLANGLFGYKNILSMNSFNS